MDLDSSRGSDGRGWILAVDFGTSNTGAAVRFADGRVEKVTLGSGSDTMPSAVVLTGSEWRVGQAALNARRTDPTTFVGAPKARLGQEPAVFGDELVSPAQIVAHVLSAVRERAVRAAGGAEPDRVVLTHPAGWGPTRLDALCEAAALAGFDPERIWLLPEPVAALHAAPAGLPLGSRVAVVDIGGGTCDVAVLETTDSGPVVVAQSGDDRLGGNDLDDLLYRWVIDRLTVSGQSQIVAALDEPENLGAALSLLDVVRAARQDLSEYPTAPVGVSVAGHDTVVTVSRDEYETLISAVMAQAADLLTRTLHESGATTLARLHLTGGTAHTPALARALHQVTGIIAEPLGDPTMAVATGALRTPDTLATPAVRPGEPGGSGAGRSAAPADPAVTLLGGRYELGEVIGSGGMAEVHLGRDQLLGRQVAIKVPHLSLVRDPAFRRRFAREAKLAGRLNHPAIVRVYDTDEADLADPTGRQVRVPFIVMERVVGRPLGDVLSDGLSADSALGIASDVLSALELAHQAGVVHRDVKPANVMVTASGAVKVMDFGIARSVAESGATTTAGVIGTAAYLSPGGAGGRWTAVDAVTLFYDDLRPDD